VNSGPPLGTETPGCGDQSRAVAHDGTRPHIARRKSFIIAGGSSQVARSGQQLIPAQLVAPGRHENIAEIIMIEAWLCSPEVKARYGVDRIGQVWYPVLWWRTVTALRNH